MNLIFEYLSHLLDSKFRLVFDLDGRIHLRCNPYFKLYSPVSNVFDYKCHMIDCCNMGGKYVRLEIRFEATNTVLQVEALQNYRSIVGQSDYNTNIRAGFILFGVCYTYLNPLSGEREVIYVDWKTELADDSEFTFIRGTHHKPLPVADAAWTELLDTPNNVENIEFADDDSVRLTVAQNNAGWIVDFQGLENDFEHLFDFEELEADEALFQ